MARRGLKNPPTIPADAVDPHGMGAHLASFLEWRRAKGFTKSTVCGDRYLVGYFLAWAKARGISRPSEVTRPVLLRYQQHLFHTRTSEGWPLSFRTQHHRLRSLKGFFGWLARNNVILYNPADALELPRREKRLPRCVLSASEAEAVIACADTATPLGVRDRAILETLYSTGMRRMELIGLGLFDVDAGRGTVMIREGKGKKDRLIPIGERAVRFIGKYLSDVRPALIVPPDSGTLFLTVVGEPLSCNRLSELVREYVWKAGIGKRGSCHLFRHTMATLMLENGADIRFIQEMLGHEQLRTTQVYTQVSIRKLKEVHTATHPARMTRETRDLTAPDDEDEAPFAAVPDTTPARNTMGPAKSSPATSTDGARAVLFDALAAEADEDGE